MYTQNKIALQLNQDTYLTNHQLNNLIQILIKSRHLHTHHDQGKH